MKVILFGATGMVGQGVLRECLIDPASKPFSPSGAAPRDDKLHEIVHTEFSDFSAIENRLSDRVVVGRLTSPREATNLDTWRSGR